MRIRVRFFALYREAVGKGEVEVEVGERATVASLLEKLERDFPKFKAGPSIVAVNAEYAEPEHRLGEGDEVALLPPMSGGEFFGITSAPISPEAIVDKVRGEGYGALVTFVGTIRGQSQGKKVLYMEYEAYKEMAEKKLRQIGEEIRARWGLKDVALCHRVGRVGVGETALVVVVAALHRKEAFEACQYAIDRVKRIVPLWKKEVREDAGVWVGEA